MPDSLHLSHVLGAALATAFFVGVAAFFRARRIRNWKRILETPACEVAALRAKRRKPAWVKRLPEGIDLGTKRPLFEALYAHYRTHPGNFTPRALRLAMNAVAAEAPFEKGGAVRPSDAISTEEKVGTLMNAPVDVEAPLPSEALAQNLVLNLVNVLKGKKKLSHGLEHALWDSLGPGGGFAGAKIGGVFGVAVAPVLIGASSALLPVWVLVGAWLGSLAGKKVGARFKARRYFAAVRKLRKNSRRFHRWFLAQFPAFLAELDREYDTAIAETRELLEKHRGGWMRFWLPDLMPAFFRLSLERLRRDRIEERRRYLAIRKQIRGIDPIRFASILEHVDAKSAREYPELVEFHRAYVEARDEIREITGPSATTPEKQKSA